MQVNIRSLVEKLHNQHFLILNEFIKISKSYLGLWRHLNLLGLWSLGNTCHNSLCSVSMLQTWYMSPADFRWSTENNLIAKTVVTSMLQLSFWKAWSKQKEITNTKVLAQWYWCWWVFFAPYFMMTSTSMYRDSIIRAEAVYWLIDKSTCIEHRKH